MVLREDFLRQKLLERVDQQAYRELRLPEGKIDFCSNDYLGIVRNAKFSYVDESTGSFRQGSTGSRLLTGNYPLIEETERSIALFHQADAGLIFNSGYDANLGLLSCVAKKGDTILYDQLSHASIRDGIRLSLAQSFSFLHNDPVDLGKKIKPAQGNIFVVTESVFSMDGDMSPLGDLAELCISYGAHLIVDEAHATGVIGKKGEGQVQMLGLQEKCFARVHTFGKAVGCHGAIVLGTHSLREYLINFSRPFMYSTALPEAGVAAIQSGYQAFPNMDGERDQLHQLISLFQKEAKALQILGSPSPIQAVIVPGNQQAKDLARKVNNMGLDVRPILYPSVPRGTERLRIVLHSFNTAEELLLLIRTLSG